jgi:hypothetical protein
VLSTHRNAITVHLLSNAASILSNRSCQ